MGFEPISSCSWDNRLTVGLLTHICCGKDLTRRKRWEMMINLRRLTKTRIVTLHRSRIPSYGERAILLVTFAFTYSATQHMCSIVVMLHIIPSFNRTHHFYANETWTFVTDLHRRISPLQGVDLLSCRTNDMVRRGTAWKYGVSAHQWARSQNRTEVRWLQINCSTTELTRQRTFQNL